MMIHELLPRYKIGDIVVYRDNTTGPKEILVQAKILGATAELEDDKWVWSYQVEPIGGELSVFLEEEHIVALLK